MQKSKAGWMRAIAFAVYTTALTVLSASAAFAQPLPSGDGFQGILSVVWGDPKPGVLADVGTRFSITYPDGTRVPLNIGPDLQNVAVQHAGKRVRVRGRASAESGSPRISVDAIEEPEDGIKPQAVIGTRKVLFILVRFQGDTQTPHSPNFFKQMTNPLIPPAGIPATINGFFDKVSYAKFKWAADVAGVGGLNPTQWFTLPHNRAFYVPCGASSACADLDKIGDDATTLATNAGVNINNYANINFVVNNDLDCCAWGGGYSNGVRSWGATWEPPWGQETSTYVHEMGHSLGLPHSGWRYYAYDSHHDEMSRGHPANVVQCGSYNSVLFGGPNTPIYCTEPGAGYIMVHQDFLGWIPAARKATHSTKTAKNYVIEANSLPLGTKLKMVKVCIVGRACSGAESSAARFITVEAKLHAGKFDNGVPSEGVIIHDVLMNRRNTISGPCYFNNQNGWAVPFDAMPGDFNTTTCSPQDQPGSGLLNMAYGVGKKYTNATLGITIAVLSKAGNTFTVKVTKTK
jgi:hypothetical protein